MKEVTTGLTVREGSVTWAAIRGTRAAATAELHSVPLGQVAFLDLPGIPESDRPAVISRLKAVSGRIRGRIAVGLSSDHVLLRSVELPAVDPAELKSMVELQVDKFSPFPAESTVSSYEVLHRTGASSRVVIAAVERRDVDAVGAVLTAAGIIPHRLDVEPLCWLRLMADAGRIAQAGCHIVVLKDLVACDIVAYQGGVPALFRSLGKSADLTDGDLLTELDYTLTTLESEHGISSVDSVTLWHWGEDPVELVGALKEGLASDVQCLSFESLPQLAEGMARRSLDQGPETMNLAVPEWIAGRQRIRTRKRLVGLCIAVVAVWAGCIAGLFAAAGVQKRTIAAMEKNLAALDGPTREARNTHHLLLAAEQRTDRSRSALECLREATELMPPGIEFRQFEYDNQKAGKVIIKGEGSDPNAVYDFESALNKSAMFAGPPPPKLERLQSPQQGKHMFTITLHLPRSDNETP